MPAFWHQQAAEAGHTGVANATLLGRFEAEKHVAYMADFFVSCTSKASPCWKCSEGRQTAHRVVLQRKARGLKSHEW